MRGISVIAISRPADFAAAKLTEGENVGKLKVGRRGVYCFARPGRQLSAAVCFPLSVSPVCLISRRRGNVPLRIIYNLQARADDRPSRRLPSPYSRPDRSLYSIFRHKYRRKKIRPSPIGQTRLSPLVFAVKRVFPATDLKKNGIFS